MRFRLGCLLFLAAAFQLNAAEEKALFPELGDLPQGSVLAPNPELRAAKDGTLLVNGKPRFLIGTTYYKEYGIRKKQPLPGYPRELSWIYEGALDYTGLQRLGFDTVGTMTPDDWIEENHYDARRKYEIFFEEDMRRYIQSGLPLYVDFTPSGRIRRKATSGNDFSAFIDSSIRKTSLVPMYYSFTTPAGRKVWRTMWEFGIRFLKKNGGRPVIYELLNQPDYDDRSEFNRKKFSEYLRTRYGNDIRRLNVEWHTAYPDFDAVGKFEEPDRNALLVEWKKFMGEQLADLCVEGMRVIRNSDRSDGVFFCIQLPNNRWYDSGVVNGALFRQLNAISAVADNVYQANFLRALSRGKLLINPESMPVRRTRSGIRDRLWLDFARGYNLSYLYKWSAARYDKIWFEQPETAGGIQRVKKPFLLLNPYSVEPESLRGIQDAKQEILQWGKLFYGRERGMRNTLGVLASKTSNNLRDITRPDPQTLCAKALESAQFSYDVLFENDLKRQLAEGVVKTIVAPGVDAVLPDTPALLKNFVASGGTLILFQCALENDEYGFPRKNNSFPGIRCGTFLTAVPRTKILHGEQLELAPYREVLIRTKMQHELMYGLTPLYSSMNYGRGQLVFLNLSAENADLSELFDNLLTGSGISPMCHVIDETTMRRVPDIEVWKAQGANKETGYLFFNQSFFPRTVRFIPEETGFFRDPVRDRRFDNSAGGGFLLTLLPGERNLLCRTDTAEHTVTPKNTPGNAAKEANLFFADLASIVNCAFTDTEPRSGPGKDYGWLDIGEKGAVYDVPTGVSRMEDGMYWNFLDPNKNTFKTCLSLRSKVYPERPGSVEIPLNKRLEVLHILHTAGGGRPAQGEEILRYTVVYADHSAIAIPIRYMEDIDDYKAVVLDRAERKAKVGFRNRQDAGLFHFRWKNPKPDIPVSYLKITSMDTETTAMIGAVTGELFDCVHRVNPLAGIDLPIQIRLSPGETSRITLPHPPNPAQEVKSAEFRLELESAEQTESWPEFTIQTGAGVPVRSTDCELEHDGTQRRIYVLPLPVSGSNSRFDTLTLHRGNDAGDPFTMNIRGMLYLNYHTGNPLEFHRAALRMNGMKRTDGNFHRLTLQFPAQGRRAELTLDIPEIDISTADYLNSVLCFNADNRSNATRLLVQAESRDAAGQEIRSPYVELLFPDRVADGKTHFFQIPAFRLLEDRSRRLTKLKLVFLTAADQELPLDGEITLYNLQLN